MTWREKVEDTRGGVGMFEVIITTVLVIGGGILLAELAWRLCVWLGGEWLLVEIGTWVLRCWRRLALGG